ncbi:hypothetical protein Tco_0270753 [Tanacetum coccineum]
MVVQLGSLEDKIPYSRYESSSCCAKCGIRLMVRYCRGCVLSYEQNLGEDLITYCGVNNETSKDFKDNSESSDDNTNVVNAPREPIIVNQDPGVKTMQSNIARSNRLCDCSPTCNSCNSGDKNSFTYDSKPNSFNDSPSVLTYPLQPQFETYLCELCGNNSHYGYDCPSRVPLVYEPEPCYNQNFSDNYYPQDSPSFSQQYLCFENCGGPHETFQCQPMNEDYYEQNPCCYPNSFGFDQYQPPQFPVYYPPQETSREILQAQEDLMEAIQAFLKEYDHIPPNEKCMALLLAEERFLKIKQAMREEQNQPEVMQELLLKLMEDLQSLKGSQQEKKETAAQSSIPYWNFSMIDNKEARDDFLKDVCTFLRKFSRISFGVTPKVILIAWERYGKIKDALIDKQYQQEDIQELMSKLLEDVRNISEELKPKAITPDLPIEEPDNSLNMGNEHLDIIPETESDEFIKSSVENLVQNPSESTDLSDCESECDVPIDDDSSEFHFMTFSNPLFDSNDDFSSDDLNIVIPIPPGIDERCFNTESDLLESLLNRDSPIDSTKIDSIFDEFSLPRPPEESKSEYSDATIESLSPSPIPVEDSDPFMEEIDILLASDDSTPPGVESDYDSEEDILLLEELLNDDFVPLAEYHHFTFDIEPDTAVKNNFDELNEDECFDPGGGENVVFLNVEEDDSFTFTIRTFLPFVTYSELPMRYGYIRNHKKTVKNGQARTRERKSEQKPEAKARKIVEGEGSRQPSETQPTPSPAPPSHEVQVTTVASHPQKTHTPRRAKRGEDERVVRAATTAISLEAEHESAAQTRFETASKQSHDLPLSEVNTSRSREDIMEHQDDLTYFIPPTPHDLPLLEGYPPRSDEDLVINKLKKKVKRLEKKQRARTLRMKLFKIGASRRKSLDKENISKQGRNLKTRPMFEEGDFDDDIDDMVNEAMENVEGDKINAGGAVNTATTGVSAASTSVTTASVSISTAEPRTTPTTTTTAFEDEDLTIAQTLVKMRSEKAKVKGVNFKDVEESARSIIILPTIDPKDKGKGIMQEPKKPLKSPIKAQIQRDAEIAQRLFEEEQAQFEREQMIARERAAEQKAKDATLIEQMEDIQARMDADELLAERLQQEEREQFTIEEKSRMLVEMIAERKRFYAA